MYGLDNQRSCYNVTAMISRVVFIEDGEIVSGGVNDEVGSASTGQRESQISTDVR